MIKLDKNGLTAPSITTGSITTGDTTISNFNQFIVKNKNGEIEETLCLGGNIRPALDGKKTFIDLGYDYDSRTGALLALRSIDYDNEPGSFSLIARDEENSADLRGYPSGELNWNSSKVITITDFTDFPTNISFSEESTESWIGYQDSRNGARLFFFTNSDNAYPGYFQLTTSRNEDDYRCLLRGTPLGKIEWRNEQYANNISLNLESSSASINSNSTNLFWVGFPGGKGAQLNLYSSKSSSQPGDFGLVARDSTGANAKYLVGKSTGDLTWGASNVVTYSLLNKLNTNIIFDSSREYGVAGFDLSTGSRLAFYSDKHTNWTGFFQLSANDGTNKVDLLGKPNGTLLWNEKQIVTQYNPTSIYFDHTSGTSKDIGYSTGNGNTNKGAYFTLYNGDDASNAGVFKLTARNVSNTCALIGTPVGDLSWNGALIAPVGTIAAFAGSSVPTGWVYCGGGAVSRTTYAKLFSVIGTKYGTGDGSTTFNLPALQGRVLQGYTDSVAIGTKIAAGLPDIQGSVNLSAGDTGSRLGLVRGSSGAFAVSKAAQKNPNSVGNLSGVYEEFTFKASSSNSIYGKSTSVQPPALAIMYIIKYK